jgi:hypothetical protein
MALGTGRTIHWIVAAAFGIAALMLLVQVATGRKPPDIR